MASSRRGGGPKRSGRQGGSLQRIRRLCAQVRRTLDLTLAGDCEDEVLQNMTVRSVESAPGNRLQVVLTVHPPGDELDKAEVLARLEAARPLLVSEIARSVERRSLPELVFWVVREGDEPEPEVR